MNPYVVTVEGREYEVDAPDEDTAWAWANEYHMEQTAPMSAEEYAADAAAGVGRGLARLGGRVMAGPGFILGGLANQFGAQEFGDKMFRESEHWTRKGNEWADAIAEAPKSMPGQVIEGVSSIVPAAVAGPAGFVPMLSGMTQEVTQNLNKELPPEEAGRAAQIQTVANAVLGPLRGVGPLTGAGVNALAGATADSLTSDYLKSRGQEKVAKEQFNWADPTARLIDLVSGGLIGYDIKAKPKTKKPKDNGNHRKSVLDAADAKAGEVFWKGEGDTIVPEPLLRNQLPEIDRTGIAPDLPPVEARPQPLPDLNTIQDQVPLLPDTPIIREGQTGETPLPTIDPRLARTEPLDVGLQGPPVDTGIVRGQDRTPLSGMAEDMPTIDFPLRQEVLDRLEIRQAVEDFIREKDRLMEAGDQKGLDQLVSDFTAGMQRLGIARPQDAFGRGLYETGRYIETGIQRTGDRNTNLATMPETKQLPLGGKQPTPAETSGFRQALDSWKKWRDDNAKRSPGRKGKQGGFINRDLLGLGAVDKLISKFGDLGALTKFRGTFDFNDLRLALEEIKANKNARLVWMTPDEFHSLAHDRNDPAFGDYGSDSEQKRASIRAALETEIGIKPDPEGRSPAIPSLHVKRMTLGGRESFAKVTGHDGRHRMDIMKEKGIDKVPVLVFDDSRTLFSYDRLIDQGDKGIIVDFPKSMDLPIDQLPGLRPRFIPKDQRGAIDVKAIREGFDKLLEGLRQKLPESPSEARQRRLNTIFKGETINLIPPDEPFTPKLKEEILAEGDTTNIITRAWMPGRIAAQEAQGRTNKLIAYVGRYLENARNRFEIRRDEITEPIKRVWKPMLRDAKSVTALSDIFFRELKRGSRYSDDVLSQVLSPREVEAYKLMRDGFDQTRDRINEIRRLKGQKEISMLDAYMASTWLGPWKAKVYKGNELVWVISETSVLGRKRAIEYLKKADPSLTFSEVKYDPRMSRKQDALKAGYDELITILGKDNLVTQTIQELMAARYLGETVNIAGVEQHFKKKTGIRGFAGDRPWVSRPAADARAMFAQQIDYMEGVLKWYEFQKVMPEIDKAMKDPDIMKARPKDLIYLDEQVKLNQGSDTAQVVKALEDLAFKATGISPQIGIHGISLAKSFFYMTKLGFSPGFVAVSLLQPYMSVPPALLAHGAKFGSGVYSLTLDGYMMAFDMLGQDLATLPHTKNMGEMLRDVAEWRMSDLSVEAAAFAKANRIVELNQMSDVRDVEAGPIQAGAERLIGPSITHPEMIARSQAYMAFVHGLKHRYDTSTQEGRLALFQKAGEIVKEVMADYDPTQKATMYQRLGIVGNAASALQTFMMNHLYQNYKYAKMAMKGNPKPFLMMQLIQLTMAGAVGMIGVEDAEDLWQFIKTMLPHDMYVEVRDTSVKKALVDILPDVVAYGGASTLTGVNIYQRFSTADMLRIPPFEPTAGNVLNGMFPFIYDITAEQIPAAVKLLRGKSELDKKEALHTLAPVALKGFTEEASMRGDVVPRMNQQQFGGVRRTERGVTLRKWGFKELSEAIQQDELFVQKGKEIEDNERLKKERDNFVRGVVAQSPDEIVRSLTRAVELGHDPSPWMSAAALDEMTMNAFTTVVERELIKLANKKNLTPREAQRLQIWNSIYNR